ncbi:glycosyltransferase [Desulfosarcina sp. OttesenSCG-928-G10]|nr:glycosyltransferase [Desulfosarcina sp. OttesenSCG-928-G10]MDL2321191.1 glycosyltransferase [Desulfosarcina sp. OttesenSCG-928-B08]
MLIDTDFIVFSDDWGRHPFSCQHIMTHFLPGNRLLWVNTIGLRTPQLTLYDVKRSFEKIAAWARPKRPKTNASFCKNLRILSPFMIPYNAIRPIRAFNRESVVRSVRKAMRDWCFKKPVLLATQPLASDYIGHFDESLVVYYCVDDFTCWPGMNQPEMVRAMENKFLAHADLTIVTSESLRRTRSHAKYPPRLLTHGVDVDHFSGSRNRNRVKPGPLCGLRGPVVGFYGLIDDRLDRKLVSRILTQHPEWNVVFIGTTTISLDEFQSAPGFLHIDAVPYDILPDYAACFDVAIVPYQVNSQTVSINPLKLKEYLAAGKPVVATPLPEVLFLAPVVRTASTPDAFINEIEAALSTPLAQESLRVVLEGERWEDKASVLSGWIMDALHQKCISGSFSDA